MIGPVLLSVAAIVASIILIKLMADWGERQFVRNLASMLDDAGYIVNEGKLPEAWVQPFREQIDTIRRKSGSENKIEHIGCKARQRCLRNIDGLIKFFQERNVTDGEETRQFLLTSLKEQRGRVAAAAWQDLLAPEASAQNEAELLAEN
jgi:hypothetical protein